MPTPDAKLFSEKWVDAWNAHDIEAVLDALPRRRGVHLTCRSARPAGNRGSGAGKDALRHYWTTALKSLPDLHFEIVGVYRGESTLVINYRNHLGGLVNEVLTFDGDGLVREGHGTYLV